MKKRRRILATLILICLFMTGISFQALAKKSDEEDEKEQLEEVSGLWWDDNGEANWDEIDGAYQYEVTLYRNGSKVTTVKTKSEKYKFYSKMTKEGEYVFRVRPLAKSKDKNYTNGVWSEYSESFDVDDDFADNARKNKTETSQKEDNTTNTNGPAPGVNGEWKSDNIGRWWQRTDGTYPANQWELIESKWYFFDAAGYMKTGWISWNNQWYYCYSDGVMAANTYVEDIYWVDENGAWKNN